MQKTRHLYFALTWDLENVDRFDYPLSTIHYPPARLSRIYVGPSRLGQAAREPHRFIKQRKRACYRQLLLVHLIYEEWALDVLLTPLPFRRIQFAPGIAVNSL